MAQTVFVSPGVYTREQDFTFFASRIGITRLGLVGLTTKGPAFEPIKVTGTENFFSRFGNTDPDYPLPYVAQAFLGQSSELTMTRILGKQGFINNAAYVIRAINSSLFTGSGSYTGVTLVANTSTSQIFNITTTYDHPTAASVSGSVVNFNTFSISASSGATTQDWATLAASLFTLTGASITVTGGDANLLFNTATTITAVASTTSIPNPYQAASLCIIRSKIDPNTNLPYYSASTSVQAVGLSAPLANFTLQGSPETPIAQKTPGFSAITVSLDESQKSYIVNALGTNPANVDGDYGLYVEMITPHFIRQAFSGGTLPQLEGLIYETGASYTDYQDSYKNSVTPMIVSKIIGTNVRDLFKFETISDGNASSREVKISIASIDDINRTFDVIVRRFDDTDANTLTQGRLELFRGLTMDDTQPNFVGKAIGTTDETYPRQSQYITVTLADNFPRNTVPAGFRGYTLRTGDTQALGAPQLMYKTMYEANDTVSKTYLGLSELAYTAYTQALAGVKNSIKTLEKDIFKYQGASASNLATIKGFHLESGATSSEFVTGVKSSVTGYTKAQAKFTVAPAGGFDGWNQFRAVTFTDDGSDAENVQCFKDAIDLMAIPETVDINLFATPDVNWYDHLGAVNYALAMVEGRADAVYIIDAPRYASDGSQDSSAIASDLQGVGLDSNYAATYWPWIQIFDPNYSQYVFTTPTAQVVKSIALTDNIAYPWFAPAGLTRGKVSCIKADVKLNRDDRDNLYDVNINPINTTISEGVTIQGQKTLQVKQSALDRINVRRLLLQVRRLIAAASQTLLFEPNDQTVRDQFLAKVEPLLLQIQNQRGLTAFRVTVDSFNTSANQTEGDRNTLTGKIQIKPTPALEFIDLTFQVLPTGANFEDF